MDKQAVGEMGAAAFVEALKSHLKIGDRQVRISVEKGMGFLKDESVYVNFVNLPTGIGGAGGGAEAENNRASFWIRGFGADGAPPPSGKVKVEESNSSLYSGSGMPSRETRVTMRAKTGSPEVIAKYLADFLKKVVETVPPKFTHTKQLNPTFDNPATQPYFPSKK